MLKTGIFSTLFLISNNLAASPTVFKCTTSSGIPAADLTVDLEKNIFSWGIRPYRIQSITDRYISAYRMGSNSDVGGEVWVLDRVTGKYIRASIDISWRTPDEVGRIPGKLEPAILQGVCKRKLL